MKKKKSVCFSLLICFSVVADYRENEVPMGRQNTVLEEDTDRPLVE